MSVLPPKLYFRIGEVAGLVGVEPHVLRYWEREFRSIRPTKSAKGQRVYSRRDVENLMRVRELLYAEGFTIAGAKKKLQRNGVEPEPVARAEESFAEPFAETLTGADGADLAPQRASELRLTPLPTPESIPVAAPTVSDVAPARVREQLVELRSEIEAFLTELGG